MTDTRVTKDDLTQQLVDAQEEITRWRQASEQCDTDAKAIDACVKALDVLQKASERQRSSALYSYPSDPSSMGSVERVLIYLRMRYGVRDASGERDALRAELEQTRQELESLRRRFGQVYEAVQS